MWLYGVDMTIVSAMSVVVVMVAIIQNKVDAFRSVKYLNVGVLFIKRSIQVCSKPMYPIRKYALLSPRETSCWGQGRMSPGWNLWAPC